MADTRALYTNNAASTLASGINDIVTSLTVAAGQGALFPSPTGSNYFYCTLADAATGLVIEIVKVTSRSTDTFTIARAQQGTSAAAFLSGDRVELRPTATGFTELAALGGTNAFTATNTFADTVALAATKKLYLDGVAMSGDTYITESSANVMDLYAGGTKTVSLSSTTATIVADMAIASGSITSASGAISFGNENLSTTGTLASGALTVTGTGSFSAAAGGYSGVQVGTGSGANTGLIIGNRSSGLGAIWSTGLTPGTNNYAVAASATDSWFNAVTTGHIQIGSADIITWTSTGATVTGTLSTTGDATIATGNAASNLTLGALAGDNIGRIYFKNSNAARNWLIDSNGSVSSGLSFTPSTAGGGVTFTTPVMTLSTTGLAVTGDLSATGTLVASCAALTLASNKQWGFQYSSNTTIVLWMKGTDGVNRSANITLA